MLNKPITPNKPLINIPEFGDVYRAETLIYYDGPVCFLAITAGSDVKFIATALKERGSFNLVKVSDKDLDNLKKNIFDLRHLYLNNTNYIVHSNPTLEVLETKDLKEENIPGEGLLMGEFMENVE